MSDHDQKAKRSERGAGGDWSGVGDLLPAPVQHKMEDAFDFDFSGVRVHEGGEASSVGALAYTQGSNLHFAPGQYDPGSSKGQELIGHELAHVVQQSEGRVAATTQFKGVAGNEDDGLEQEADVWGTRAARGESVGRASGGSWAAASDFVAPVQRFKDYGAAGAKDGKKNVHWANGTELRVADDATVAVAQESIAGSQEMYLEPSRLAGVNAKLKSVNAPFTLVKTSGSVKGATPANLDTAQHTLERVKPVELSDPSKTKEIPDDCGNAARTVTGAFSDGKNLKAEYVGKDGKETNATYGDPEMMKYEIMVNHFGDKIPNVKNVLADVEAKIASVSALGEKVKPHEAELVSVRKALDAAQADVEAVVKSHETLKSLHEAKVKAIQASGASDADAQVKAAEAAFQAERAKLIEKFKKLKAIFDAADKKWNDLLARDVGGGKTLRDLLTEYFGEVAARDKLVADIMGPYEALAAKDQEAFDEKVHINRHANPDVGEAYTISSGGKSANPNKSTWNFHWGGVILKSTTGSDNITMENYAGSADSDWVFQMYGVPTKADPHTGQTFHEQHRDVHEQHGTTPTTLQTEKT